MATDRKITPLGLAGNYAPVGFRSPDVPLLGQSIQASAGQVSVVAGSARRAQLSPLGLSTKPRNFNKTAPIQDAIFTITGAQIQGQWNYLDSAHATIYTDGVDVSGTAGVAIGDASEDEAVPLTGAATAAEAGTLTAQGSIATSLSGAQTQAKAGTVTVLETAGTAVTILGADISSGAGTVTLNYGWSQTLTGAKIDVPAVEVGIDTGPLPADVSVTIYGAAISGQAGNLVQSGDVSLIGNMPQGFSGGSKPRSKKRYVATVDGQRFIFDTMAALEQFLQTVKETAAEAAQQAATAKPPVLTVRTSSGKPTTSSKIEEAVADTQRTVNAAFAQIAQDKVTEQQRQEDQLLSNLLIEKLIEDDDEDAVLVLLLS